METRLVLTDAQWAKMAPHCLGKPSDPGRSGTNNRLFVEAVLWIARTGCPWRDLPPSFGNWNTVFKRYRDWIKAAVFQRLFEAVSDDPDMEYAMIDGTVVKVHRHGQGAKGGLKIRP
jgi:transposase